VRRSLLPALGTGLVAVAMVAAADASGRARSAAPSPAGLAALLPRPVAVTPGHGSFVLRPEAAIRVGGGEGARQVADQLAALLRPATGYRLPVLAARGEAPREGIVLWLEAGRRDLGEEGYELRVGPDGVAVTARRAAGLFYGVQTFRQLLPASVESGRRQPGPWRLPVGVVRDRPRFVWRGAMLDVARHFFPVADVKRFVDLLARYKLNRLHLHLSDDQGWRLQVRSWPRLTSVGGRTEVGGGPGGWYTQRRYADLVAYAAARHVTVVPEIDLPGHTNAALAAYARLNCDGAAREPFTGIDVGFSSLCIRKELTYRFVDDVVREVAALTPGPYLHIGGDEATATQPADYAYFVERVQRIVRAHGKVPIGWEETARVPLPPGALVQHWRDAALARRAAETGARLIMSPADKAYLDMKYEPDTPIGLQWAGTTGVRDAYSWDPVRHVAGLDENDVLGVEAPLWTETTTTVADLDFLAFPRLLGHAELAWSPAAGRRWPDYRRRLGAHGPRLRALGVGFHAAPGIPWG
jgi:hexosaminidase